MKTTHNNKTSSDLILNQDQLLTSSDLNPTRLNLEHLWNQKVLKDQSKSTIDMKSSKFLVHNQANLQTLSNPNSTRSHLDQLSNLKASKEESKFTSNLKSYEIPSNRQNNLLVFGDLNPSRAYFDHLSNIDMHQDQQPKSTINIKSQSVLSHHQDNLTTSSDLISTRTMLDHLLNHQTSQDYQSKLTINIKSHIALNHQAPITTSRDIERILSIHNIIKVLHQWNESDFVDLDNRTYFFTIPIDGLYNIKNISNVIYSRVRKQLGFQDESCRIGMLIGLDVNGTRSRTILHQDRLNPHLHAIVFLPRCVAPATRDQEQSILHGWKSSIGQLHEVRNRTHSDQEEYGYQDKVFAQRFDPKKSVIHTAGYGHKADAHYNEILNNKTEIVTFPYKKADKALQTPDIYQSESSLDLAFRLHLFPETIFSRKHPNDLTAWQMYHRQRYTEAGSSKDKVSERNRFLSALGVGPYSRYQSH